MKCVKRPRRHQAHRVISDYPHYKSSKQIQARRNLKICKDEANITLIGKVFPISPTVYAKEGSIMFVRGAGKTSLRPLALVLFVLINILSCFKSILLRLCIIIYKIISLDILTWVYNVCIFNNDKRRSYDREVNPEIILVNKL